MEAATIDWSMGSRAAAIADWGTAADTGRRVGGSGPPSTQAERAEMREDLTEIVPRAETLITGFTQLSSDAGFRSRAWVMSRGEWVNANLNGLQRLLEPLAARVLPEGAPRSGFRRKVLGAQIGGLLGYVSRKVLGQYDAFLPPDDDGLLYFVGPNLIDVERRFHLPPRDFRLWVAIHEVTHRVQFGATPWLRPYLERLIGRYLETVQVDSREVLAQMRRAVDAVRAGADWRGANGILLLMNDEQRALFAQMQSLMTLLEGHATFVMNTVAEGEVQDLDRMRNALRQRRHSRTGVERSFQQAIGFETKVKQYAAGERFVQAVVERAGMDGFNEIWREEANLPTAEEIVQPTRWVGRVAGG
ncbi:MAG TPA: zinc-dependent metalloprotease [Actinomycetota bacterium]|nr:zinc-dependent metalloprotease [Actinomycetota bacterium]